MKRALITAVLAGMLTLHGLTSANAAEYPASPAQGGVDTGTVPPGGSVEFDGVGMAPGEQVTVTTSCTTASDGSGTASMSTVASATGTFASTVTLAQPGACTLTAQGSTTGKSVTAQVTVREAEDIAVGFAADGAAADAAGASQGLAATGMGTPLLVWAAVGLGSLGLGTIAVATAGRRGQDTEAR